MFRMNARRASRRSGFTLIELITVVAIITVVVGLSIGAFFRVRVSQQEKATETTLFKVQSEFDNQTRAVLDSCKEEERNAKIPATVLALAGGDNRRAKAIWTKIRIKQEFPHSFWDALAWPQQMSQQQVYLDAKFRAALQGMVPRDPATLTVDRQLQESAVLLYLTLTKGRRGNTAFNPAEHIGPHAIGRLAIQIDPNNAALGTRDFDVFIDSWGNPICFIRWPFGATPSDLSSPTYQTLNKSGQPIDLQDPERTLLDPIWYNNANLRNSFIYMIGHPLANPPQNLSAVIFSAGRDKRPGLEMIVQQSPSPYSPIVYLQRVSNDEDDNIYAFRQKGVGRNN